MRGGGLHAGTLVSDLLLLAPQVVAVFGKCVHLDGWRSVGGYCRNPSSEQGHR